MDLALVKGRVMTEQGLEEGLAKTIAWFDKNRSEQPGKAGNLTPTGHAS